MCGEGCRFRTSNVEYMLPGVSHVRVRMLRVRAVCAAAQVSFSRERACARARRCVPAGMFLPWTCVGARKHVSASIALPQSSMVADAAQITQPSPNCSVPSRLVVDDVQPAPPYAPDNTSHLSGIVRLQLVHGESRLVQSTPIKRRRGTAQAQISAGNAYVRRQRIRWTPKLLLHESRCERTRK